MKLLLCCVIFPALFSSYVCELTLVQDGRDLKCIESDTSNSSALAWIYLNDDRVSPSSEWVSDLQSDDLSDPTCDLSKNKCQGWYSSYNGNWKEVQWNNTEVEHYVNFGPVLDHRWNSFKQKKLHASTDFNFDKITLPEWPAWPDAGYKQEIKLRLHMSVLLPDSAHIVLTSGISVYYDPSYMIVVGGYEGRRSFVRICPQGLPFSSGARRTCTNMAQNITTYNVLYDGTEWTDLTLTLVKQRDQRGVESLELILDVDKQQLLTWTHDQPLEVKYLWMKSYSKTGYWRLHDYKVLAGKTIYKDFQVTRQRSVCLSITYFATTQSSVQIDPYNKIIELKAGDEWQVKKIWETLYQGSYRLTISSQNDIFIGDVRMCNNHEVYVSTLTDGTGASCSSLKSKEIVTIKEISNNAKGTCSDDTFGPGCSLSCSKTLGKDDCRGVKTCSASLCSCLPQYHGDKCDQPAACPYNTWGSKCDLKCGHCLISRCDTKTGDCEGGCEERWTGPKCNIKYPVVKASPKIDKTYVNEFDIKVWTALDDEISTAATYFQLQYREQTETTWRNATDKKVMYYATSLQQISGLHGKTTYHIRTVLLLNDGTGYTGDVKYNVGKTACKLVGAKNIDISATTNIITIDWQIDRDDCDANIYEYWIGKTWSIGKYNSISSLPVSITQLEPETNYYVYVYYKDSGALKKITNTKVTTGRDRGSKLSKEPILMDTQVDSVTIKITYEADRNADNIRFIQTQYQEIPYNSVWLNGSQFPWFRSELTLQGLKSNTQYRVRAVLLEHDKTGYFGNDVPYVDVLTSCLEINKSLIKIDESETSFSVTWEVQDSSCPLNFYEYNDPKSDMIKTVTKLPIVIDGLTADTEYQFNLGLQSQRQGHKLNIFEEKVKTMREPFPYLLEKLEVIKILPNSFTLALNSMKKQYSTKYVKEIQLQYKVPADKTWQTGAQFAWTPRPQQMTLRGLKSDTQYDIRAVLLEDKGSGDFGEHIPVLNANTSCLTLDKNTIQTDTEETMIKITWKQTKENCPVSQYTFSLDGDENKRFETLPITFDNLAASNEYNLKISHESFAADILEKSIKTKDPPSFVGIILSVFAVILITAVCGTLFCVRRKRQMSRTEEQPLHINVNPPDNSIAAPQELDLILPERTRPMTSVRVPRVAAPLPPAVEHNNIVSDAKAGASEILTHVVKLQELEDYVENCLLTGELKRQHGLFPRGQTQPWDYGHLLENKMKNRYVNLVAYDATRVKLTPTPGDLHSDYINANYIDGYKNPRAYIATQGPKPSTCIDFWRMIWQEKTNLILMVANTVENGKNKCEKYWPDFGHVVVYGDVEIICTKEQFFADYTFRDLSIKCNNDERKILQLHFTAWPDHGVPCYPQSLATFLKKALTFRTTGPIVVHCSAGVGRTGTVILADACLRMASAEGQMDPLSLMQTMRSQRPNMVDNAEQYQLVHIVLIECLLTDAFAIPCSQYATQLGQMLAEHRSILDRQFSRLNKLCQKDAARKNMRTDFPWPEEKSRFPEIAPGNYGRVILNRPMGGGEYINAVYVDGFRTKGQFIATQLPLPDTVTDLWHLVDQAKVALIVVLNQPDQQNDQSTCEFLPQNDYQLQVSDTSSVILKKYHESENRATISVQIENILDQQDEQVQSEHEVKVVVLKGWKPGDEAPASPLDLLELWEEVERSYTGEAPIIVMCHDGATACGLFIASAFVVEKIKLETEIDVGLAVRTIRSNRPQFVSSLNQYEFIHQTALAYLDSFETYANFQ